MGFRYRYRTSDHPIQTGGEPELASRIFFLPGRGHQRTRRAGVGQRWDALQRLLRSGRNGELGGLFRRPTAYSVHTWHTWHAPEPAKYAKYVPTMCRGSGRTMRDWMHLQLPIESRSRPEPVLIAKMSGMGEIVENAPNEANFAESTSIVEAQDLAPFCMAFLTILAGFFGDLADQGANRRACGPEKRCF